ncbi:MAG: sigma-54-dependent Fis family transcriptional regulator [Isosphaeraceae bacterium]|nr:sigma-54-dependent Fis family transcriptional regulator [Isosphaeraceae bacterium]
MDKDIFRILIVDDEPNIRNGLAKALADPSYEVATASEGDEALALLRQRPPHLIITDLKMPGPNAGLDLIRRIKEERPETMIIVITAYGTIETAVAAMRLGSYDFITKPIDLGRLRAVVQGAFEEYRRRLEDHLVRDLGEAAEPFAGMIGQSAVMRELREQIRRVADTKATVLIQGESGTGKELVARAIHGLSARRRGPFVAVNVGAVPETLIESELFGYEKGAFSGADRRKPGWFEMAQHGTLFLDEIGEMLPRTQVDLLRILERSEVRRLGGAALIPLDVRLVVATHCDVKELVAAGKLREDVYYRLIVVPLYVPPLRERREDLPLLVQHFLEQARQHHHRGPKQIAGAAMQRLHNYSWPGNVRQLRNVIERLVITVTGPTIHVEDLPGEILDVPHQAAETLEAAVQEAEKAAILAALEKCNHHRERAAQLLGISVRTLHYKLNRYSIS